MAQVATIVDIQDYSIFSRSMFIQAAVIHEPVAASTGLGTTPYVGLFVQFQSTGTSESPAAEAGRLRTRANYNDGTSEFLTDSGNPFESSYPTIPSQTPAWAIIRADGNVYAARAPSDDSDLAQSAQANLRERIPLSATKTLSSVTFFWTAD